MKICHVVGARPNFMKAAPLIAEMGRFPDRFEQILIHTGQHYDNNLSEIFLNELELPRPHEFLNTGSGTHAEQTARILAAFEPVILKHRPDWVVVVGDVNSTLACALVCSKTGIPVAHVEAGLRSGDRTMPEEINRLLTDQIADLLFTPSDDADVNLLREGIPASKIHLVGNIMIDSLVKALPLASRRPALKELGLEAGRYVLVTLHRPSSVDDLELLQKILSALAQIAQTQTVVFPVHPRTRKAIAQLNAPALPAGLKMTEPLGYLDFLALMKSAGVVLTDSGGIQEETTYLDIPCLTLRDNTERPITLRLGTNQLVPRTAEAILRAVEEQLARPKRRAALPPFWDGRTAQRIVQVMRAG